MQKILKFVLVTLVFPFVIEQNKALAVVTSGPMPKDISYSDNETFDSPNIFFNNKTDTIQIFGQTSLSTSSTYEARIYFPGNIGARGLLFNEFYYGLEDKWLTVGPNNVQGYNYPNYPNYPLSSIKSSKELSLDAWHHVAFVQGGGTQRLYLDGQLVAKRAGSGDIYDNSYGDASLGANVRIGPSIYHFVPSFIGHLDTLRISNIARYTGNSFDFPTGDLIADANTQILYNFNWQDFFQKDGATWVKDLSGKNKDGKFGTGFLGATSPSIVVPLKTIESVNNNLSSILENTSNADHLGDQLADLGEIFNSEVDMEKVQKTSVPEPSPILGLIPLGFILGFRSLYKRKQQEKISISTRTK